MVENFHGAGGVEEFTPHGGEEFQDKWRKELPIEASSQDKPPIYSVGVLRLRKEGDMKFKLNLLNILKWPH